MNHLLQEYLPMPEIARQVHLRGAINASYAQLMGEGLRHALLALFDRMKETWKHRRVDQSFVADLDQIRPEKLTRSACDRLRGLVDFIDPGLDVDELKSGHAQLFVIRGKGVARIAQDAQAACEHAVRDTFVKLHATLAALMAATPSRARALTAEIKKVLQALVFPSANVEAQSRLQRLLRIIDQLQSRSSSLPESTLANALHQIVAEAQRQHATAVAAVGADLAEGEFRRQIARLVAYLDELVARTGEFVQKLNQIRVVLELGLKQAALEGHVSRASVALPLPGPEESELLAGMLTRTGQSDLNALGEWLLDSFETRLREEASRLCPHLDPIKAPLSELVRGAEAERLAALFTRLVEESVGAGSTIYEAIERIGVEKVVSFLHRRAGSTVDLADRDVEQFNISPLMLTIVRLPPAVGPSDPALRERVRVAFGRIADCTFTDGAADDRVVTVVRAHVGWPIGIESSNRALLDRYVRAGRHGHRPHLVGFVPDSPSGEMSGSVVALADTPETDGPYDQPTNPEDL